MASREKLSLDHEETTDTTEERELSLRDGRKLVVGETNGQQLVEIRSPAGMVEVRIKLTEEGPVLAMESARLELKATEEIALESKRVSIKGTEELALAGGEVKLESEKDTQIEAKNHVRVVGKMIYLN